MNISSEPIIIQHGRSLIGDYDEDRYRALLRQIFIDGRYEYIILDDKMSGHAFYAACVAWAVDNGYLRCDCYCPDEGSAPSTYRITDEGMGAI